MSLDIGVVLQAPMQDKEWLKKCALFGLLTFGVVLIPLAGWVLAPLNALGWMRTYADARLRGETEIPPPNLGYLGAGWRVFLSFLPLAGLMIAVVIVMAIIVAIAAATKIEAIAALGSILGMLIYIPVVLWMMVMQAAMLYLHIVKGEPWASMRFGDQWSLVRRTGTEYLLLWVAFLCAGVIGQLGMIACLVGVFVSFPYMYLMQGAALAEFAKVTNNA
jgi:hypothetical protein